MPKLPRITRSISNITELTAYMSELSKLREELNHMQSDNPNYEQLYRNVTVGDAVLERLLEKAEH